MEKKECSIFRLSLSLNYQSGSLPDHATSEKKNSYCKYENPNYVSDMMNREIFEGNEELNN